MAFRKGMMTVYKERLGAVPFQYTSFDEAVHMVPALQD